MTPGLIPCIADGPGCLELSYFERSGNERFNVFRAFSERAVTLSVLDANGETVARMKSLPMSMMESPGSPAEQAQQPSQMLDLTGLPEGTYFLRTEGPPGDILLIPVERQP
jgi:hypothetical protein